MSETALNRALTERITLTRREAAAVIGVGLKKIDRLVTAGALPSFLEDGTRLFPVWGLYAWADRRAQEDSGHVRPDATGERHLSLARGAA